jgi:CRP-like cAMP-binding protein
MANIAKPDAPSANLLLASMKSFARSTLFPHLRPSSRRLGEIMYSENEVQDVIYFPTSGIVSLLYMMENGNSAEMAIVGSEGLVGFAAVLGGKSTTTRALVQVASQGFTIKRRIFERVAEADSHLRRLLNCYMQTLLTQFAQTAVCNRHHSIEQQWCRWMLMSLDRNADTPIRMTQQMIADMLGVRREGVSIVSNALRSRGVIEYSRGIISVRDRGLLEERVCECYALVAQETERLLPGSNRR